MILLATLGLAEAASCCTATGIDPLVLSQGETLAALLGSEAQLQSGLAESATSVGGTLRLRPWILLGARVPVLLSWDTQGPGYGLGHP